MCTPTIGDSALIPEITTSASTRRRGASGSPWIFSCWGQTPSVKVGKFPVWGLTPNCGKLLEISDLIVVLTQLAR